MEQPDVYQSPDFVDWILVRLFGKVAIYGAYSQEQEFLSIPPNRYEFTGPSRTIKDQYDDDNYVETSSSITEENPSISSSWSLTSLISPIMKRFSTEDSQRTHVANRRVISIEKTNDQLFNNAKRKTSDMIEMYQKKITHLEKQITDRQKKAQILIEKSKKKNISSSDMKKYTEESRNVAKSIVKRRHKISDHEKRIESLENMLEVYENNQCNLDHINTMKTINQATSLVSEELDEDKLHTVFDESKENQEKQEYINSLLENNTSMIENSSLYSNGTMMVDYRLEEEVDEWLNELSNKNINDDDDNNNKVADTKDQRPKQEHYTKEFSISNSGKSNAKGREQAGTQVGAS